MSALARSFRRAAGAVTFVVALCGCESLGVTQKVKNPVVPPPPRRVATADSAIAGTGAAGRAEGQTADSASGVTQASHEEPAGRWKSATNPDMLAWQSRTEAESQAQTLGHGEIAATVNGVPIFVDDVLLPLAANLQKAEKAMPPDEFRKQRRALVEKLVSSHIEQELLIQALKAKVKDEQLKGLEKFIDGQFDEELKQTMARLGVSTVGELEIQLRKSGSSIEVLKANFRNRRLAQQFLGLKAAPKAGVDRADLVAWYQEHLDDYAVPGQVRWQQIRLDFDRHGGKTRALELANELCERLDAGGDFSEIAKKHSQGATASAGGHWEWTLQGSLAAKEVDRALFELSTGDTSQPIVGANAIEIVRVLERKDATHKSFESVQAEIKTKLREGEFKRSVQELLDELAAAATIEKYTDRL